MPTENIIGLVSEGDEMVMLLDIASLLEVDADEAGVTGADPQPCFAARQQKWQVT